MQTSALSCCHLFFIMPELTLIHNETSISTACLVFARPYEVKLTQPEPASFCTIHWAHTSSRAPCLDTCDITQVYNQVPCRSAGHVISGAQQDGRARDESLGKINVQSLRPQRSGVAQLGSTRKGLCRQQDTC